MLAKDLLLEFIDRNMGSIVVFVLYKLVYKSLNVQNPSALHIFIPVLVFDRSL